MRINWCDYFSYEDGKLYWKASRGRIRAGSEAGSADQQGYIVVRLNGKDYKAHRIIWEMHYGPIPEGMEVDHIWHNRKDNRIENLRLVTRTGNGRNQSKFATNTSGVTGVNWNSQAGKWRAEIYVGGKHISLGLFTIFNDAVLARKSAEAKYGFHKNHGE